MQLLLIIFIVLAVVSGLGIAFLYLSKNTKVKTGIFYFLCVWSMIISYINATGLPSNYVVQQLIAWSFGFLAVLAIIVKVKTPSKPSLPNLIVTASLLCGLIDLFFF